ncbi:MAG: MATE family efflux transporter [Eubacteriales bacterium]|nr:MATE family efflux transporter [Eubacteriales bacterium]
MPRRDLVRNTALLTASSLLMSAFGMLFQAWLAGRLGPAGLGLWQLTLSTGNLAATFAISGVRFAATRLVAEELGREEAGDVRAAMRRCLAYGSFFGIAALLGLLLLAEPIGVLAIGDARCVPALRLTAASLPCIALSSALSGYFTACGRIGKPTLIHLFEQLCGALLVWRFLGLVSGEDLARNAAAVALGRAAADLLSLLLMFFAYGRDVRGHSSTGGGEALTARLLRIALPLALSAYARSTLSTLQHLLVPRGLRAAGYTADKALAGYGIVHGMSLPLLLFPACLLAALAELIVPELTEMQVRREEDTIVRTVRSLLTKSFLYSLIVGALLFFCADPLAFHIYKSSQAGRYIRILAPLVPILYTDMAVDGCLKGLGQQLWSMAINVLDALFGLFLLWKLLPRYALTGYLALVYLSEIFNFTLSALRLRRVLPHGAPSGDRRPCGGSAKCAYKGAS